MLRRWCVLYGLFQGRLVGRLVPRRGASGRGSDEVLIQWMMCGQGCPFFTLFHDY